MSVNQVVRNVGLSLGSAIGGLVLLLPQSDLLGVLADRQAPDARTQIIDLISEVGGIDLDETPGANSTTSRGRSRSRNDSPVFESHASYSRRRSSPSPSLRQSDCINDHLDDALQKKAS